MENELKLKNDLIEQIENFEYEIRRLYDEHILFTKLNILKIEVESEYVTLENLQLYCEILCGLVKNFNGVKIEKLGPKIEDELQKLEEKAKMIQEIEKNTEPIKITVKKLINEAFEKETSKQESSEEIDFSSLWFGAIGLFFVGGIGYVTVTFTAISLGITMAAATGIFVGGIIGAAFAIGIAVWGIGKVVKAFMNWLEDKNLSKISQKTQEIAEKIPEKQIEQKEKNIETIDKEQSLILYIKNDLLIQVEKLKNKVPRKYTAELTQELNGLEDNIKESNSLDDLKQISVDLYNFAGKVVNGMKLFKIRYSVEVINNRIGYIQKHLEPEQSIQQQNNKDRYQNVISQVREQNSQNKFKISKRASNSQIRQDEILD